MQRQISLLGEYVYLYQSVGGMPKFDWSLDEKELSNPLCKAIYKFPEGNSCKEIKDFISNQIIGDNWEKIK